MDVAYNVLGIDIIVEGGNYRLMKRPDVHSAADHTFVKEEDALDYPTIVKNALNEPVLIVAAGAFGSHIGHLIAWFDEQGNVIGWEGDSVHVINF